eukprot:scaffold10063_cov41-Phaeocystis_antarctica.AAC.2
MGALLPWRPRVLRPCDMEYVMLHLSRISWWLIKPYCCGDREAARSGGGRRRRRRTAGRAMKVRPGAGE